MNYYFCIFTLFFGLSIGQFILQDVVVKDYNNHLISKVINGHTIFLPDIHGQNFGGNEAIGLANDAWVEEVIYWKLNTSAIVVPSGKTINDLLYANVTYYTHPSGSSAHPAFSAYYTSISWDEYSITYATQPSTSGSADVPASSGVQDNRVYNFVNVVKDNHPNVVSVKIGCSSCSERTYHSLESTNTGRLPTFSYGFN